MMHKKLFVFIISLAIIFTLVNLHTAAVFGIDQFPIPRATTFDHYIRTDYRDMISSEQPDIIILGDSAIRQLDADKVSAVTGRKTLIFTAPGTGSAYWYLFIRNQVYLADYKPEYFIIFFRDSTLTVPEYRVHGEYFIRLEEIAASWDEDVYELAINNRKPRITRYFEGYVPVYTYRSEIYFNIVQWFRNYLPERLLGENKQAVDIAYEAVFEREQVNDLLWEELLLNIDSLLYTPESLDFSQRVNHSFLPAMLRDLNAMGIQPIFIRVRYRSHALGELDQDNLISYLSELAAYIKAENGTYEDLSQLDALTADMYEDNFHIHEVYGKQATEIIARELLQLVQ